MENRAKTRDSRQQPPPMDDALNDALMATFPASDPLAMVSTLISGGHDESSKSAPQAVTR